MRQRKRAERHFLNPKLTRRLTQTIAAFIVIVRTAIGVIHAACWDTGTAQKSTGIYKVQSTGTVVDTQSGLMWKQCVEGLSGTTCATGGAISKSWDAGVATASGSTFAGYNDWRMPALTELQSLLPSDCTGPKINTVVFPNTPLIFYWSGSPFAGSPVGVWYLNFNVGGSFGNTRDTGHYVRLVRDGQSFDILTPVAQTLTFNMRLALPFGGAALVTATSAAPSQVTPSFTPAQRLPCAALTPAAAW